MLRRTRSQDSNGNKAVSSYTKKKTIIDGTDAQIDPRLFYTEEERFKRLKGTRKTATREMIVEAFKLELSPFFLVRFFEVLKVDSEIDLFGFQKIARVLEGNSQLERQRVAFYMFAPFGEGRIAKQEFKKVTAELLVGATKNIPIPQPSSAAQATIKTVAQQITDAVYGIYCTDELRGLDFREWLSFAIEDAETARLLAALDRRIQFQETVLRRRFADRS
jgi:hypothetical protein